jgi:hypothetical protein
MTFSPTPLAQRVTADGLLAMPDDALRRVLVDGEVWTAPPSGEEHGVVAAGILISLGHHVMSHVSPGDTTSTARSGAPARYPVAIPERSIRSRLTKATSGAITVSGSVPMRKPVSAAWTLPSPFGRVEAKVARWLAAGCRMVVVVNPERRAATVYRSLNEVRLLTEGDVLDGGDVVPGWVLPLRDLFV